MSILKKCLKRATKDGATDTIHLETSADLVICADGSKLSETIDSMKSDATGIADQIGDIGSLLDQINGEVV